MAAGPKKPQLPQFAASYGEARARFLEAADAAGAALTAHRHPEAVGPDGEVLATDVAWIGPADAATVLLCLSGTHGAEGYGGSAVQTAWLAGGGADALPRDVALCLVHAVNPFGFAWGLRGTEDNIDINRNWLDHAGPYPANPIYEEIHPFLCPRTIDGHSVDAMLGAAAALIEKHGQWALEDAISRGQYTHPDGFHFGGNRFAWGTQMLQALVRERLGRAKAVAYVDFHTGPVGNGERIFLCFSPPSSRGWRRACDWWGRPALDARNVARQWGSKRPSRHGIVFWGLEDMLRGQAEVAGAIVEFCSSERQKDHRRAMRVPMLERWLRFEGGYDAPEALAYFTEIRHHYAPRRRTWEDKVLAGGIETLDKALAGCARWRTAEVVPERA